MSLTDRPGIRVTTTHMADGRELVYYDDSPEYVDGSRTRRLDDPRPLGERFVPTVAADGSTTPFTGPEMRRDPLTGDWVPMASHRMNRTFLPAADACPLCPARPADAGDGAYSDGEIPDTSYDVAVFENRFPSLLRAPETPNDGSVGSVGHGPETIDEDPFAALRHSAPAAGRCEVVCFSSDHTTSFADLSPARVRTIIEAWADRTTALGAMPGISQVFCFENRGREIGVTLPHPHGQIYGYPYLTPRTQRLLEQARAYAERTGGNLLRDVLHSEQAAGERLVLTSEHWTAYVPYAARWPVEVHLAPHRDVGSLPELTDAERDDLAVIYLELLRRADRFFVDADGTPIPLPYIAAWHQAPVTRAGHATSPDGAPLARLHLELFSVLRAPGKLKYLAGSESGMGAWISDTTPERIAARFAELGPLHLGAPAPRAAWSEADGSARVRSLFARTFGPGPEEVGVWSAPGRVNVVGEHTDYNAGLCLPIALEHRTFVALRPREDDLVRIASAQEPGVRELDLADVAPGTVEGWPAYVAGVAWALREAGHAMRGFDAVVDSCVPYGAGLSSSAAIECAFAAALDSVSGLGLGSDDAGRATLAAACIRAENEIAGAPTGGMDQSASLRSVAGHALLLDCAPGLDAAESAEIVPFDLAAAGLALLVIDTRAEHQLVDGQYAARRATCEAAATTLGVPHLRALADEIAAEADPGVALTKALDSLADDVSRRRVRHVVTEIGRVRDVVALVRDGRADEIGPLLDASHESLRDDYEVSCRELDLAVSTARDAGALGARMTGGGFGGSAIALVRTQDASSVGAAVVAAFAAAGLTAPDLLLATASDAAGRSA